MNTLISVKFFLISVISVVHFLPQRSQRTQRGRSFIVGFAAFVFFLIPFLESKEIPSGQNAIDLQGSSLWEVHDYAEAYVMYEQLLSQPLPTWQKARLYYNLGTLLLAQKQNMEALDFYRKIPPMDLSLPLFATHLLLNKGIAYLKEASQAVLEIILAAKSS